MMQHDHHHDHQSNPTRITAEAARRARRDAERRALIEAEARRPARGIRIDDMLVAARPPIAGLR